MQRLEMIDLVNATFPFGVLALAAVFIALLVVLWRRTRKVSYLLCAVVFTAYLLMAANVVLFPIPVGREYDEAMRGVDFFTSFVNLIPFKFNLEIPELAYREILQNTLLTVPFGFGLPFLARVTPRRMLWAALAIGLATESGQLLVTLLIRNPYRAIDVNDVLLNGLGVLVGYGLFRLFAWVYVWLVGRTRLKNWGLPGYLYEVSSRA